MNRANTVSCQCGWSHTALPGDAHGPIRELLDHRLFDHKTKEVAA